MSEPTSPTTPPLTPLPPLAEATPQRPVAVNRYAWLPWFCLSLVILAQALYVGAFYAPALATPDANGYWAQGSLIARSGKATFQAESDIQYIGMHWLITENGEYASRYPPGLPLLIAAVYAVFGHEAAVRINPLLAALTLLGLFALGKRVAGPWWSLLACGVLAANPVFNQHALWCFAHMAVACLLVWGVYLLVAWSQSGRWWQALLAGFVLGAIPAVRYPEAIFALGIGLFLIWIAARKPDLRKHLPLAVLGAAVPVGALLVRNHLVFGAFWRTGYALTNEQSGFAWSYFGEHFIPYLRGLSGEGVGPFFALGVLGAAGLVCSKEHRPFGVLLVLLTVPLTLLYMAYYWGSSRGGPMAGTASMGLRFLLPTFALYALAGAWGLAQALANRTLALRVAALVSLVLLQVGWGVVQQAEELDRLGRTKALLASLTHEIERTAADGEILLADRGIHEHLDYVRRWRLADLSLVQGRLMRGRGAGSGAQGEDEPSPMQQEKSKLLEERYGHFSAQNRAYQLARELDGWAGERKVYFVGSAEDLAQLSGFFQPSDFTVVARVPVPKQPANARSARELLSDGPRGDPPPGAPDDPLGLGGGPRTAPPPALGRSNRGGGGPMGNLNRLLESKELVIAEWTARPPEQRVYDPRSEEGRRDSRRRRRREFMEDPEEGRGWPPPPGEPGEGRRPPFEGPEGRRPPPPWDLAPEGRRPPGEGMQPPPPPRGEGGEEQRPPPRAP